MQFCQFWNLLAFLKVQDNLFSNKKIAGVKETGAMCSFIAMSPKHLRKEIERMLRKLVEELEKRQYNKCPTLEENGIWLVTTPGQISSRRLVTLNGGDCNLSVPPKCPDHSGLGIMVACCESDQIKKAKTENTFDLVR